ncbi:UDP-3-O-acyl-N-acetylglucosamine deacetylase [Desulfopila aestuarii]|uniref:UDP-3-O-acyl-N-acetylglucosamine deacetylase n=1 Tax=Desulfopila aestuarii DSM 18488 TaxID=1121416 RepID=A0A1M7YKM0_9BACT|nr:UDP-3-O-acyl-N-acetylglucosamine deacetylase [Desulfopila aestuarii]SHO53163.1 UDP-3-O-[3-hydroxymyristoyl] N-acetylglucosamine deacetylase [Desulfopila aestuarii DSM 18488]
MSLPLDPHQYTLKKTVSCCGVGLHSGRTVNLTIKPAPVDNGIRFFRSDLAPGKPIKAHMNKVVDTRLATTIGEDACTVSTTEHLMAALHAYGIDNADIELDAGEVPIMDGSAEPFFQLIKKTGKRRQPGLRKVLRITRPITYVDGDKRITISPFNGLRITGEIEFDDTLIRTQKYSITLHDNGFGQEIARARTFGYVEQVEELWANGLALGGTLENVIAIHWNRKSILNEDGLRFDNEFIRHKVLDLLGDIALLGCPVLGHVEAFKAGHAQHLGLMQAIASQPECWEIIEMQQNGAYAVFNHMLNGSRAAGDLIMPFLSNAPVSAAA